MSEYPSQSKLESAAKQATNLTNTYLVNSKAHLISVQTKVMKSKKQSPSTYGKLKKAIQENEEMRNSGLKGSNENLGLMSSNKFLGISDKNFKQQSPSPFPPGRNSKNKQSLKEIKSKRPSRNMFGVKRSSGGMTMLSSVQQIDHDVDHHYENKETKKPKLSLIQPL